jgi:Tol biopolymer transport system component/DNA-binding winged helix-turn-helix (wHTH) protein
MIDANPARSSAFRVGDWLVEPAWNRIRGHGGAVKLEPRVMRLLATLAASPGRPLPRQELLETIWPDVLVNEEALSRAVSQLRRALGDDPRAPRFIETVHKGGYCLIAPVADASAETARAPNLKAERDGRRLPWRLLPILAVGLAAVFLIYQSLAPAPRPQAPRRLVPLTSEPGREIDPAVSPDGRRIAYLASSGADYDLFMRDMVGGAPVRLTRSALAKGHPVWSPAGDRIAFIAADGDAAAIYFVSAKGGAAAKLIDLSSWSFGLDWSPDGRTLAYSDAAPGETAGVVLLDIASKAVRPIPRSAGSAGDVKPVFSPDGKRLAFLRHDPFERQQIAVVDLQQGGEADVLGPPPQQLRGVDWAPGGEALIYSARSGRRFSLWRLAADGAAAPEALPAEGGDLFNPSISRDGRIVVEDVEQDRDIWVANLGRAGSAPLIRSTFDDYEPAYAPDGARLAFVSERSGTPEIWVQPSRGEPRPLTRLNGPEIRRISWSPDGRRLAFLAERDGGASIYAAEPKGGELVRLLQTGQGRIPIGWAAAGDALFMLAPDAGQWRLEAFSLSGRESRPIAAPRLRLAAVAADGRSIFAVPAGENKLLRIAPGEGVVRQFRLPPLPGLSGLLAATGSLYLVEDEFGTALVRRLDLNSGRVGAAVRIDYYGGGTLTLDADGRSLAYTRTRETANDLAWTQL